MLAGAERGYGLRKNGVSELEVAWKLRPDTLDIKALKGLSLDLLDLDLAVLLLLLLLLLTLIDCLWGSAVGCRDWSLANLKGLVNAPEQKAVPVVEMAQVVIHQ